MCIRRLVIKLFISGFILHITVLDNNTVVADLSVIPVWNAARNQNATGHCLLTCEDTYRNEVVKFRGHPLHTWGVQLTPSNGTLALVQIPQGVFLCAERQGNIHNCQQRCVSINTNESCIFVSQYAQLRLFLPGYNRTVLTSGIQSNSSVPSCPGQPGQHELQVSIHLHIPDVIRWCSNWILFVYDVIRIWLFIN